MNWGLEAGGLFGAAVGVLCLYRHFQLQSAGKASVGWPIAPGRILVSKITEKESWDNGIRSVDNIPTVSYAYDVAGNSHSADKIAYKIFLNMTQIQAQSVLDKYPVGAAVSVHYQPSDPSQSVLETGAQSTMVQLIIGVIFLPLGLLLMWAGSNG
jgi:hypothetical protein